MPLTIQSAPRISLGQYTRVLRRAGSPCAPIAHECYDITRDSGIDPAVALAFFAKESVFGTRGVAAETKSWGNVRTPFRPERGVGMHPKNFVIYASWQDGLLDWCERINERYIKQRGLDTVEKIVPVYAPSADGNAPREYIDKINQLVAEWIKEDAPSGTESAFQQFVLSETRAGRPLGNPITDVRQVKLNGQDYLIQVFALDTICAPAARIHEVYRLSDLLKSR